MKAVIIGSGIAGLACAIRMAQQGYYTEVFETNAFVGGKLSEFKLNGFRFDRGPSLFTMPKLIEELFELCGLDPQKEFPYIKLHESCRYFYDDGKVFKAYNDQQLLAQEIKNVFDVDANMFMNHLERSKTMHQFAPTPREYQNMAAICSKSSWFAAILQIIGILSNDDLSANL